MGRGRLLISKVKEARALKTAELQAVLKFQRHKGWNDRLREWMDEAIKKIDPVELLAMGSATVLIHQYILKDTSILTRVNNAFATLSYAVTQPWMVWLQGLTSYIGMGWLWGPPPGYMEDSLTTGSPFLDQLMLWLLSFLVAFVLIKWGGQLLSGLAGGMFALIGLFI